MKTFSPQFEQLEPRRVPGVLAPARDVGHGLVRLSERPLFDTPGVPGWEGGLSVLDLSAATNEVWVGPAAGEPAAPRVRVYDAATFVLKRDFFVGSPDARAGVLFVNPLAASLAAPTGPALSPAPLGDPKHYTVFFDFEGPISPEQQARVMAQAKGYFGDLPVYFTARRPAAPPGEYGTVVVGAPTSWPGWSSAGYAPETNFARWPDETPWRQKAVYASWLGDDTGAVAAHELGHALGLFHKDGTLMAPSLAPALGFDDEQKAHILAVLSVWLLAHSA